MAGLTALGSSSKYRYQLQRFHRWCGKPVRCWIVNCLHCGLLLAVGVPVIAKKIVCPCWLLAWLCVRWICWQHDGRSVIIMEEATSSRRRRTQNSILYVLVCRIHLRMSANPCRKEAILLLDGHSVGYYVHNEGRSSNEAQHPKTET
jgi:hypothetical protein